MKRMVGHEFVVFDHRGFIDGQWGNLVFTSRELLDRARTDLARIACDSEKALAASLFRHAESLEAKRPLFVNWPRPARRASMESKDSRPSWSNFSVRTGKNEIYDFAHGCDASALIK